MKYTKIFLRIALTLSILFLFLIAIKLLGSSFKYFGKGYIDALFTTGINPFSGLFIGILATVLVQSSSVTTVIVVGLVSGNVLSVGSAVPMIMGANIGTTVTNLIVSFGHVGRREDFRRAFGGSVIHDFFNLIAVAILLPLEMLTGFLEKTATSLSHLLYGMSGVAYESPIKVAVTNCVSGIQKSFQETFPFSQDMVGVLLIILAFVLIFVSLFGLVKLLRQMVMGHVVQILNNTLAKSAFITMAIGAFITVLVQSSSVTTSMLVPLIGGGIISLEVAFPIVLGANVGTTVTALLAALAGNEAGLTIALVHLLFNMTGIILLYPIKAVRAIPLAMARGMGDLVFKRRRMAVVFVVTVFFIIPLAVIFISRAMTGQL